MGRSRSLLLMVSKGRDDHAQILHESAFEVLHDGEPDPFQKPSVAAVEIMPPDVSIEVQTLALLKKRIVTSISYKT